MQIDLNLKCGGKVTRVEILKNDKIVRTINMCSHNHIVRGGRDYICTWRGNNQMPYKGLWANEGGYSGYDGCHEVITGLNMLYGFPNVQNNFGFTFQQNGDTINNDSQSPLNNRHGQIGPLTFGKIGVSNSPTNDTDTDLHAPVTNTVIDSYNNNLRGWHATKMGSDNSLTIRTAYSFSVAESCVIKEFGTFGRYVPSAFDITSSNYNSESIYTEERMFTRTVLEQEVPLNPDEKMIVVYEFTIYFPAKTEVPTTLAGHDCVRSFHLPAKNSSTTLDAWYSFTSNCDNLPIGFITTRSHTISSGSFSKFSNTVSSTIDNSSCFPLCSLRFCCTSTRASSYAKNYTRGINACSALGMSPIAYIEDCTGAYSAWYRQCLRTEDTNGKLRNMLADCATYTHTMEDYVPGTGYRIHNITLGSFNTNRPRVYGIGLMGFIYRFGHYEGGQFIVEPISIPAGYSISYKVKLQISNIESEEGSESEESSGS